MARIEIVVVGLGNPGREYQDTRHNIGFRVIDLLAKRHATGIPRSKHQSLIIPARVSERAAALVKPLTYMNRSGDAVKGVARESYLDADSVWVIYDDFNLDLGTLRLRPSGSDGGHNGMKSIIASLGSDVFPRIRLGIGRGHGASDDRDFVLSRFRPDERETVARLVERAADALERALTDGVELAMSQFNGSVVPAELCLSR